MKLQRFDSASGNMSFEEDIEHSVERRFGEGYRITSLRTEAQAHTSGFVEAPHITETIDITLVRTRTFRHESED